MFNQPEVALGIIPGGTGTVRLPRLIGRSRALEVILGCDDIDAGTAERWGWVNRVLPTDELATFVDRLAARIASFPPHAVAAAKASVVRGGGRASSSSCSPRATRSAGRSATRCRVPDDGALPRAGRPDPRAASAGSARLSGRARFDGRQPMRRRIAAAWAGKPSWSARAMIDGAIAGQRGARRRGRPPCA